MRRAVLAAVGLAALALGATAVAAPILGLTGSADRFKSQVGQDTVVRQAFLGWGQGQSYGSPFGVLLQSLGPVPMLHLSTQGRGGKTAAVTPGSIATGAGDGYLAALNAAISRWGKAIYVRPMAEMNNSGNPWSGFLSSGASRGSAYTPAQYRRAFARIAVLLHGGTPAQVAARLRELGEPPYRGPALAENAFPRLRVVWSPLAGGSPRSASNDPTEYYPGNAYVDVVGGDIYKEAGSAPPWNALDALRVFAGAHGKPFAVPEWGLFGVDDGRFVTDMCTFLKRNAVETEEFYESKPGSIFDLASKPASRKAYADCIVPLAGELPSWATGGPGTATKVALSLTPDPDAGDAPLATTFAVAARLSVPIVHWQILFGDGKTAGGAGPPPTTVAHRYAAGGTYTALLAVFPAAPYDLATATFLATATVAVSAGDPVASVAPSVSSGRAPLKVSFRLRVAPTLHVNGWRLVFGDGLETVRTGAPPSFAGHTFTKPGSYTVLLLLETARGELAAVAPVAVH
ncbi:MAG TPA: hypothetical protein VHC45_02170 [Gaiellaceae bacterium]|nr:hypothetical protein [Gaiellaceae bacterium]